MRIYGVSTNLYGWGERYGWDTPRERIFADCKAAGLDAIEMDPVPERRPLLAAAGLRTSGSYIGAPLHEEWAVLDAEPAFLPVARRVAAAGGTDLVVNADPKGGWTAKLAKTEDDLKRQGENLTRLARLVALLGVRVCFHNHADSQAATEADLRSVIEFADKSVGLCVDTGWAWHSGCDPLQWLRLYPERVFAFLLRNQHGQVPAEDLSEGDIDMAELVRTLGSIPYTGWLTLELWHPPATNPRRTLLEAAARSVTYLKRLLERDTTAGGSS